MSKPFRFDGMEISNSSEMASLLRRQLRSGILSDQTTDQGPEEALWRLFHSIEDTPAEQFYVDAVMDLLMDSDIATRSFAVGLAQDSADRFDPGRLLALLDEHPALYKNVESQGPSKSDFQGDDLAWGLLRAIAGRPTDNPKVLARLKEAATDRAHGARVLAGLTVSDPEWVLRNLGDLVDQEPRRASIVLNNLSDAAKRKAYALAASRLSPGGRKAAIKAVKDKVEDPEERTLLLSLLAKS